jgi:arylsulfatase A-like enzyme
MTNDHPYGIETEKNKAVFDQVKRRDFLRMVGGAGALMAVQGAVNLWPSAAEAAEAIGERRNVIFFTTDQQQNLRWFPEGWEAANLPGLTRLRNKGVSFTRAYTNTAMCTPARTTLFTGLYPAQHRNFDTLSEGMSQSMQEHQLDPTLPNIGTIFKAAGYDVVWKGKWHMSKGVDNPDDTSTSDDIARYGMNMWNSPDAGGDAKMPNYGGGNPDNDGRFFDGSTWLPEPKGNALLDPELIFTQAEGTPNPAHELESAYAFLKEKIANPGGNPFCLMICLINPHDVLGCPGISVADGGNGTYIEGGYWSDTGAYGKQLTEHGDPYASSPWSRQTGPLSITVPPTAHEDLVLNLKPTCQEEFKLKSLGLGLVNDDAKKLKYLNFYGNLMKMNDRKLVKLLDLLDGEAVGVDPVKARHLRDNSWTIFSSDHGDGAMTHGGLRQKSFMCYEEVLNIPLVWSNPVDFPTGQVCDQLVSHVDFLPTLCSLVGINTAGYDLRGVDYSRLMRSPAGPAVQDSILFTFDDIYCGQEESSNPNGLVNPPNRLRTLIEKDYKYSYYFDGNGVQAPQSEFYDLRSQANGGTDTDEDNDLGGTTGKAVEYTNYSEWAENKRLVKKATPELRAKRTEMEAKLKLAIDTKLTPLSQRPAVPPEDFQVQHFEYMDSGTLQNKLQITWLSRSNTQYQLQESLDQTTWRAVKDSDGKDMAPILGNNGPVWVTHRVSEHKVFYRLAWFPKTEANAPEPSSVVA